MKKEKDWIQYQAYKYKSSFQTFPLQELAFTHYNTLQDNDNSSFLFQNQNSILYSMEPRLFAIENTYGKRRYIATHYGRFVHQYILNTSTLHRHYYELIPHKQHCRLYFDLEFDKSTNSLNKELERTLMQEFIWELQQEIQVQFHLFLQEEQIVELDSSTVKKFSRHLIVHMPNHALFQDAIHVGYFVKGFVARLAEEVATGAMIQKGRNVLAKYLFVFSKVKSEGDCDMNRNRKQTCFVDIGVYTRNRIFRILGSRKFGKGSDAVLRIAKENKFPFPSGFTNECLYDKNEKDVDDEKNQARKDASSGDGNGENENEADEASLDAKESYNRIDLEAYAKALSDTLVIPIAQDRTSAPILKVDNPLDANQQTIDVTKLNGKEKSKTVMQSSNYRNRVGSTPFPELDKFVNRNLANWKRINGSIRSWSWNENVPLAYTTISYQIKDNRFCENIGREHKSNNIMWHVSIADRIYWQSCFDPECRLSSNSCPRRDLPPDISESISEVLIERELQVTESFEQALLDLSLGGDGLNKQRMNADKNNTQEEDYYVSESFEQALLNLTLDDANRNESAIQSKTANSGDVHESFEKALMNLNIEDAQGNKVSSNSDDDASSNSSSSKQKRTLSSSLEVNESFERALMNLNIDEIVKKDEKEEGLN